MDHALSLKDKLTELNIKNESYFPSLVNEGKDYVHEYQFDFVNHPEEAVRNLELTIK